MNRFSAMAFNPFAKLRKTFTRLGGSVTKRVLARRHRVVHLGRTVFTLRNFGHMTRMRAETFSTKEPETIAWIDGFAAHAKLLDIGANVGVYSLYAGLKGHEVRCIEPDALNFALLNLNIADNGLGGRVIAYPFSIHSESKVAELNVGEYRWGGARSSFDRNVNWKGEVLGEGFSQGSPGITVDDFVAKTGFVPDHIKIDVDGNELLVLQGARSTLSNPQCRSILVEMFDRHEEYRACLDIIEASGFRPADQGDRAAGKAKNYIFTK
ncbi:MAG: FkbM family methyltransferase [Alphaproteobacteria bacterium]|nr:FkbM family methyltransferase [Alphaproteobacteria bacterium]